MDRKQKFLAACRALVQAESLPPALSALERIRRRSRFLRMLLDRFPGDDPSQEDVQSLVEILDESDAAFGLPAEVVERLSRVRESREGLSTLYERVLDFQKRLDAEMRTYQDSVPVDRRAEAQQLLSALGDCPLLSDAERVDIDRILKRPHAPLAFCGGNSSGKSTVINALLGRSICITGEGHVTGRIMRITRAASPEDMKLQVIGPDGVVVSTIPIATDMLDGDCAALRRLIADYTRRPENRAEFAAWVPYQVHVYLSLPSLDHGIEFYDLPGESGTDHAATATTLVDFIGKQLPTVVLCYANPAFSNQEVAAFRLIDSVLKHACVCPRIFYLSTHADLEVMKADGVWDGSKTSLGRAFSILHEARLVKLHQSLPEHARASVDPSGFACMSGADSTLALGGLEPKSTHLHGLRAVQQRLFAFALVAEEYMLDRVIEKMVLAGDAYFKFVIRFADEEEATVQQRADEAIQAFSNFRTEAVDRIVAIVNSIPERVRARTMDVRSELEVYALRIALPAYDGKRRGPVENDATEQFTNIFFAECEKRIMDVVHTAVLAEIQSALADVAAQILPKFGDNEFVLAALQSVMGVNMWGQGTKHMIATVGVVAASIGASAVFTALMFSGSYTLAVLASLGVLVGGGVIVGVVALVAGAVVAIVKGSEKIDDTWKLNKAAAILGRLQKYNSDPGDARRLVDMRVAQVYDRLVHEVNRRRDLALYCKILGSELRLRLLELGATPSNLEVQLQAHKFALHGSRLAVDFTHSFGCSQFTEVFAGLLIRDGVEVPVAVKVALFASEMGAQVLAREAHAQRAIGGQGDCPHVLQLEGVAYITDDGRFKGQIGVLLPRCQQTLRQLVETRRASGNPLSGVEKMELALQAARAVVEVHAKMFIHRNVSTDTYLMRGDGQLLLTGAGVAVIDRHADGAATPFYIPMEQNEDTDYGTAVDVFALGYVLYYIAEEQDADSVVVRDAIDKTHHDVIVPRWSDPPVHPEYISLVRQCWVELPAFRPPATKVVAHLLTILADVQRATST